MSEQLIITSFAQAIADNDIATVQQKSSEELKEKALNNPDSLKELEFLKLPTGKAKVLNVENIEDDKKKVVVEVGKKKTKLQYILVKNEKNKWVVDNIIFKKELKGLTSSRSLIDQMTFLLTMRETVDAWETGNRNNILELCTVELREELEKLPPAYLAQLGKKVFGKPETKKSRPKGQLDDDIAIVQLNRKNGILVITMKSKNDQWRVEDIALQHRNEDKHVASLKKNAIVVNSCHQFLTAYKQTDRKSLQEVSSTSFYRGSLKFADLSAYPLPQLDSVENNFKVVIRKSTANLIITGPTELTKIRLKKETNQSDIKTKTKYEVEEVVLYELENNKEEKRLSGMFTAQGVMKIFHEAWVNQDLKMLRKTSTRDFSHRIWDNMNKEILPSLQLPELPEDAPEVLNVSFQGPIIEITVNHGNRTVSYILKEHSGVVQVDDILLPVDNRPKSFKETLSLLKPIHQLALGIQTDQLKLIRNSVSKGFDQTVWSQLGHVPEACNSIPFMVQAPIVSISNENGFKTVYLGFEDEDQVKITFDSYQSNYFIDTIEFVDSQSDETQTVNLKIKLKELLAAGQIKPRVTSKVVSADFLIEDKIDEPVEKVSGESLQKISLPITPEEDQINMPEPSDDAFTTPEE